MGVHATQVRSEEMRPEEFQGILDKFNEITGWKISIETFKFEGPGLKEK